MHFDSVDEIRTTGSSRNKLTPPSGACICLNLAPLLRIPPPKIPIRQPVNYLRMRSSMTTDNNTCHRIKKFCWRSNPKSPGLLFWVFYTLEEQSFQQMLPWTRIEFQLSHLKDFKLKQRSASFGIQRNFKLNKDSQTEIFSLVSAVSNPKEPKTSTNFCILCAVREELTYICRVLFN